MSLLSLDHLAAEEERRKYNRIENLFRDNGQFRRELYVKHMAFFAAGATETERLIIAANRVGKTVVGGYETVVHLTGIYPDWWIGRRFNEPVNWWAAGDTSETTRDIQQLELLGDIEDIGTGLIPKELIIDYTKKRGIPDAVDKVYIKNIWDEKTPSVIGFKSFDQGRKKFQGTAKHGIWLDEECPIDVSGECLLRLMTLDGILLLTFTPLSGLSELVQEFVGEGFDSAPKKWYINATWDDAPHLTEAQKIKYLAKIPAYQREARTKGIPALGAGAIYPVEDSRIEVDDFKIPDHWPRIRGIDTGWNHTSGVWIAFDPETKVKYTYADYKTGLVEPPVHAIAINARGDWIEGPIDYSGTNQRDGTKVADEYLELSVLVYNADKTGKEGDLFNNYNEMIAGKHKVFKSCRFWWSEKRLYHRDGKGNIVKKNDHVMDAWQYANKVPILDWVTKSKEEDEEDWIEGMDTNVC